MYKSWPDAKEGRIATKNRTGFMFLDIGGVSKDFIEEAKTLTGTVMDLGCAYGVVTLEVLKASKAHVTAFDLSEEHLGILKQSISEKAKKKLTTVVGTFPEDFKVDDQTLEAIHCSFLFHFLSGEDTQRGLDKLYSALKPGGKLYINTISVYFNFFEKFLPSYKFNENQGVKWPGEIHNFLDYIPEEDKKNAPNFFHVYTKDVLEKSLIDARFKVEKSFYYDVKEPSWFASGGRGTIGLIAVKPYDSPQ